jgi:hypothetical protein
LADLLECVIQIKALRVTLALAETETPSSSGGEPAHIERVQVWQAMCEEERRYAVALGTIVAGGAAPTPPDAGPAGFVALRRANLAILDCSTADQVAGFVEWPGRPSTTVADLVALMLANDTEVLGEVRRPRSGNPSASRPSASVEAV